MSKRGILTVISGFSGAGKGTLVKKLMEDYEDYALSISATTRLPREGEVPGREYFFTTEEEFQNMILEDRLIEFAKYVNNYYGTPKKYVDEQLSLGKDVILEIEIQGALKIKEKLPDTLLVFISPPSIKELKNRLLKRGTESIDVIESRLARAAEEVKGLEAYDYFLVNDQLEECSKSLHQVIQNEHLRVNRNKELIQQIKAELEQISKGE